MNNKLVTFTFIHDFRTHVQKQTELLYIVDNGGHMIWYVLFGCPTASMAQTDYCLQFDTLPLALIVMFY